MSKPGAFTLSKDAKDFVFSNLDVLRAHLKIVFPAMLLITVINQIGTATGHKWVEFVTLAPYLALYAAFALSWHRSSLMGPDKDHAVHPARVGREEWMFIGLFMVLTLIPGLIAASIGFIAGYASHALGKAAAIALIIFLITIAMALMIFVLRVYFILPARSVGVKLSVREALKASRGLAWPVFGASIILFIIFMLAVIIYQGTLMVVVGSIAGDVEIDKTNAGILQFFLSIPVLMATFLLTAGNVTVISRAYKWGMENNPVT